MPEITVERIQATLGKHSRIGDAAVELGLTLDALTNRLRRKNLRPGDFLARVAVPEGMRVRGLTTRLDRNGNVREQSVKVDLESDDPPKFEPVPEAHAIKGMSTFLGPQGEVRGQWVKTDQQKQKSWQQFWSACERATAAYRGIASSTPAPKLADDRLLTLYPLGDPHIGMLAWGREVGVDFDVRIAERDLLAAIDLLVDRAPASHEAVLANVGDFFHAENDAQLTPTGKNKLDCDTRWAKLTEIGFSIMRRLIDRLREKHQRVRIVNVPGNHDPQMARMLALWLKAVYENEPRVEVIDNVNPYMYLRHGACLFGFAHGDGARAEQLPAVMAADRPEDWGAAEFRMWVTGHIHHTTRKETPGCVVESFRTLATRDYWHHHKGYRSGQSLSAITFDREFGEITRSTVDLKFVRAVSSKSGVGRRNKAVCETSTAKKPRSKKSSNGANGRRSRSRASN